MGFGSKKPKPAPIIEPPAITAQEKAFDRRNLVALDKEISEENRRKKALLSSTLGTQSLLTNILPTGGGAGVFTGSVFAGSAASPAAPSAVPLTPITAVGKGRSSFRRSARAAGSF